MLFKDACNAKSNQQNLGTIKSSNLCTEIVEYTAPDEVRIETSVPFLRSCRSSYLHFTFSLPSPTFLTILS